MRVLNSRLTAAATRFSPSFGRPQRRQTSSVPARIAPVVGLAGATAAGAVHFIRSEVVEEEKLKHQTSSTSKHSFKDGAAGTAAKLQRELSRSLKERAWELSRHAKLAEAEPLLSEALNLDEEDGGDAEEVARDLSDLALALGMQGRYDQAERLLRRALELDEASVRSGGGSGSNGINSKGASKDSKSSSDLTAVTPQLDVCADRSNLALVLGEMGQREEAETLLRNCVADAEKILPENDPQLALWRGNLARALARRSAYDEALPLFRRSHAALASSRGPEHHDTLGAAEWLACVYIKQGRYDLAQPLLERVVDVLAANASASNGHSGGSSGIGDSGGGSSSGCDEATSGPSAWVHPMVATAVHNLAELLAGQGDLVKAESLYRRMVLINEATYGEAHEKVALALQTLASVLWSQGRLGEALPMLCRVLYIRQAAVGETHPQFAAALNDLGLLLKQAGRLDDAEPLLWRSLEITEDAYGQTHPLYATGLFNLASLMVAMGRHDAAEPLLREAVTVSEPEVGEDHPDTLTYLSVLASVLRERREVQEARNLLQRVAAGAARGRIARLYWAAKRQLNELECEAAVMVNGGGGGSGGGNCGSSSGGSGGSGCCDCGLSGGDVNVSERGDASSSVGGGSGPLGEADAAAAVIAGVIGNGAGSDASQRESDASAVGGASRGDAGTGAGG